jgi:hypothetical protein
MLRDAREVVTACRLWQKRTLELNGTGFRKFFAV